MIFMMIMPSHTRARLRTELLTIFALMVGIIIILGVAAYVDSTQGLIGKWASQLYNVVVRS